MSTAFRQFMTPDMSLAGQGLPWLDQARAAARAEFEASGLPQARDEDWKYTAIRPIQKQTYGRPGDVKDGLTADALQPLSYPGLDCYTRVFENGRFHPGHAAGPAMPEGVVCEPLARAFDRHARPLAEFFKRKFEGSGQGFAALNTALSDDGLYLRLPAGLKLELPMLFLFVSTPEQEPVAIHPRIIIHLERDSELVLVESYSGLGEHKNLTNVLSQVELEAGATLRHLRIQREERKAMLVNRTDINVGRDASYTGFAIDLGGRLVRHDLNVTLNEPGAACALNGLYVLGGRQHVDNHTRIDHAAPYTRSDEVYKGVLDGHARGVFNGKVVVHGNCDGTDASQSNANLLLSDNAEIDTKPELEIYADDVKCSHGATIGQLDENALFYLRTRGLSLDEARGLLTYAFCREVVDRLQNNAVRERLAGELLEHLPSGLIASDML